MRHLTAAVALAVGLTAGAASAAEPATPALAAHRALYELQLEQGRKDVIAGAGTMEYEVTDACDAWAVRQRLHMRVTGRDGNESDTLSDYTTLESKDGKKLRFRLRQTNDGDVTTEIAGTATMSATGGEAKYRLPEEATKALPAGTLFPMAHTSALIAAAQAGHKFTAIPLFDGTGITGAQNSTISVINWTTTSQSTWSPLTSLPSGRVRIAFFDRDATSPEADYEVGMRYFANGVADDMSMDFGDFVMLAKIKELTVAKPGC